MTTNELKLYLDQLNIKLNEQNELFYFIFNESINSKKISNKQLTSTELKIFKKLIRKLKRGMPVARAAESKYFFNKEFKVLKNVLIPRPETELIVEEILKIDLSNKKVIDMCCGTGAIGLAIISNSNNNFNLKMYDLSKMAIKNAKLNSKKLIPSANIKIERQDFFKVKNLGANIFVMNPPYISMREKESLDKKTLNYDPHSALFAKKNGLEFYDFLFKNIDNYVDINQPFRIICEFGHEQKNDIYDIWKKINYKAKIFFKKDYSGNWRYFIIIK